MIISSARPRPAMLSDWIGEVKEEFISERYRIGPGDICRSAETAVWLMTF